MFRDNLGRIIEDFSTDVLATGLQKSTQTVDDTKQDKSEKNDRLFEATQNVASVLGENFESVMSDAQSHAKSIISAVESSKDSFSSVIKSQYDDMKSWFDKIHEQFEKFNENGESNNILEQVTEIVKMGSSPRTFWVGLGSIDSQAAKVLKGILDDCGICKTEKAGKTSKKAEDADLGVKAAEALSGGGGGAGGGGGGGTAAAAAGGGGGGGKGGVGFLPWLQSAAQLVSAATAGLAMAFEMNMSKAFQGVIHDSNEFRMQLREIVYQTRGFGDTNREIEESIKGGN